MIKPPAIAFVDWFGLKKKKKKNGKIINDLFGVGLIDIRYNEKNYVIIYR
jgi:hypothetical protein